VSADVVNPMKLPWSAMTDMPNNKHSAIRAER
jgi:hypothetical protein